MNFDNFLNQMNTIIFNSLEQIEGRTMNDAVVDELTEILDRRLSQLYAQYGLAPEKIDREFTLRFLNTLLDEGVVAVSETAPAGHRLAQIDEPDGYVPDGYVPYGDETDARCNPETGFEPDEEEGDPEIYSKEVPFPENWGENLNGNVDAVYWANEFAVMAEIRPDWIKDSEYLTAWFANAIMTGYDKAKAEEFPYAEKAAEDYIYLEFYDSAPDCDEDVEATFKFHTMDAAKEFIKLNSGTQFKSRYYRFYELTPETVLTRKEIN